LWQDKMSQAQAKAYAQSAQAQNLQGQAAQTGQMWQSVGSGVGAAAGAAGNYMNSQQARADAAKQADLARADAAKQADLNRQAITQTGAYAPKTTTKKVYNANGQEVMGPGY
jgi:hypothetical protein